jgi:hypothetical protein
MPDPSPPPPRRQRSPAPVADPRLRHCQLVDLMATAIERVVLAPESSNISAPEDSRGDGLELPRHAALSVSARFPGSERRGPNGFKRGESA